MQKQICYSLNIYFMYQGNELLLFVILYQRHILLCWKRVWKSKDIASQVTNHQKESKLLIQDTFLFQIFNVQSVYLFLNDVNHKMNELIIENNVLRKSKMIHRNSKIS